MREFGGAVIQWLPGLEATRYVVRTSQDGRSWKCGWSTIEVQLPPFHARQTPGLPMATGGDELMAGGVQRRQQMTADKPCRPHQNNLHGNP